MRLLIPVLSKSLELLKAKNPSLVEKKVFVRGTNGRKGHYRMQWTLPGGPGAQAGEKQLDLFAEDAPVKKPQSKTTERGRILRELKSRINEIVEGIAATTVHNIKLRGEMNEMGRELENTMMDKMLVQDGINTMSDTEFNKEVSAWKDKIDKKAGSLKLQNFSFGQGGEFDDDRAEALMDMGGKYAQAQDDFANKMNKQNTKKPEAKQPPKQIDQAKAESMGKVKVTSVGEENVYFEKDGKEYYFKPGNTGKYQVGEHDFGSKNKSESIGGLGDDELFREYSKYTDLIDSGESTKEQDQRYEDLYNEVMRRTKGMSDYERGQAVAGALKKIPGAYDEAGKQGREREAQALNQEAVAQATKKPSPEDDYYDKDQVRNNSIMKIDGNSYKVVSTINGYRVYAGEGKYGKTDRGSWDTKSKVLAEFTGSGTPTYGRMRELIREQQAKGEKLYLTPANAPKVPMKRYHAEDDKPSYSAKELKDAMVKLEQNLNDHKKRVGTGTNQYQTGMKRLKEMEAEYDRMTAKKPAGKPIEFHPYRTNVLDMVGAKGLQTADGKPVTIERPGMNFIVKVGGKTEYEGDSNLAASTVLTRIEVYHGSDLKKSLSPSDRLKARGLMK